jgi:hypothetical protein
MQNSNQGCSEKQHGPYTTSRHAHFGAPPRRRPARDNLSVEKNLNEDRDGDPAVTMVRNPETSYLVVDRDEFANLVDIAQTLTSAVVRLYDWAATTGRRLGMDDVPLIGPQVDSDTTRRDAE